jgi:Gpi18-like mannosyltransferase
MDSLPNWAWWTIAGGTLLSPLFAFLLSLLVEALIGAVIQGGIPALILLASTVILGRLLFWKQQMRWHAANRLGDQA